MDILFGFKILPANPPTSQIANVTEETIDQALKVLSYIFETRA